MKFVDIQVNGAFGVDFNDDNLTEEQFVFAAERLQETGVGAFLPTLITDNLDNMCHKLERMALWVEKNSFFKNLVPGFHIEGPFISGTAGFRGTHPEFDIKQATPESASKLVAAGRGLVKLVTLAPEQDAQFKTIQWLRNNDIVVFGGHSDADYSTLDMAIKSGLQGFTHLGNGCAMEVNRHDNILHRILAFRKLLFISLIADGIHVPWWLLRSWSDVIPSEHVIVTSDSMSAAGMPPGEYQMGNQHIVVEEDRRTRHRGHQYLAGSASTMQDMERHINMWVSHTSKNQSLYFGENARRLLKLPPG